MKTLIDFAERGRLPDWLISYGVRNLSAERLNMYKDLTLEECRDIKREFIQKLAQSPLAVATDKANEQHYELPPEYFNLVLGNRLKYSCCYWPHHVTSLDDAEVEALKLTAEHAQIEDGMEVLELGCGWGSLSTWIAKYYPNGKVVSISNSQSQRKFIEARCQEMNLNNLTVQTADINTFQTSQQFDRVVSVEMFEHLRNYHELFKRISGWLKPDGKLFTHIFTHAKYAYLFETDGAKNWMGQHFFTGGMMPSDDLFHYFQDDLSIENQWQWSGEHYQKTSRAWLQKQNEKRDQILDIFEKVYGEDQKLIWFNRWRMFYIAVAEVFGYKHGKEWGVSHYLFKKR